MTSPSPTKDELLGHIDPSKRHDFSEIDGRYTSKTNIYMRTLAYTSFERMYYAALEEGVKLQIISATRNFNYQRGIWERKWKRPQYMGWQDLDKVKDIMKYSAMPGTSRHHWGTDIDLNALENSWFESGEGLEVYTWLCEHASSYGFFQTYTSKDSGRTGYAEEKWHWSYMPIAKELLKSYTVQISYEDIQGFSGSSNAEGVRAIEDYVQGVALK